MEFKSLWTRQYTLYVWMPCPGMPYTGTIYLRNSDLNKKIMEDNKIKSAYEYRKFLQKNALTLMKYDYETRLHNNNSTNRCKVNPHGGIVDINGVIGPEGIDNMPLQTSSDGQDTRNIQNQFQWWKQDVMILFHHVKTYNMLIV